VAQRQRSGREDRGRRPGIALPSEDVEDDIGRMDALSNRFGAGSLVFSSSRFLNRRRGVKNRSRTSPTWFSTCQPWSNGRTEGQITKLKLVKRQMYGKAKIDLLQARLIGVT
jgi:hypothetical protein